MSTKAAATYTLVWLQSDSLLLSGISLTVLKAVILGIYNGYTCAVHLNTFCGNKFFLKLLVHVMRKAPYSRLEMSTGHLTNFQNSV